MQHPGFGRQRGISLIGVIFFGGIMVFLAIFAMKVVPAYIEFHSLKGVIVDATRGKETPQQVRSAFDRYMEINMIDVISGKDLDITKNEKGFAASFKYTKTIPFGDKVRLEIDFAASSNDQ
ncbi:MAG: DUF4845 domain-containing protein [Burkholderiaceae bacterium]|nr:MAG: DUF4845 domain-containing protein [Burkholderiaceae bacterium]